MSGSRKPAKLAGGCPLDGRVGRHGLLRTDIAVRAGNDYDVPIWISQPKLAVIGERIDFQWFQKLCARF